MFTKKLVIPVQPENAVLETPERIPAVRSDSVTKYLGNLAGVLSSIENLEVTSVTNASGIDLANAKTAEKKWMRLI